jgi:hypothetical protein
MLERCGSIADHENHVDRRPYESVAALRQRIEKETLTRWHRLVIGLFDHHRRSAFCSAAFSVSTTSMSSTQS